MPSPRTISAADRSNRSRLLQAATDAFAEQGYEGTSLRTIADDAGVSFQLIAYYFGTKEELWVETVDYLFERYLETGKGLGFTPSGNLHEQFHNHLRLLLTDMLQRPQLRKIWIQEYLAGSDRYANVIKPKIKLLHDTLSLPYFQEVVRLGIVRRFTAEEIALIWSSVVQNNVVYPYFVELLLALPEGSSKSVERQVDLLFSVLTAELVVADGEPAPGDALAAGAAMDEPPAARRAAVYALDDARELTPEANLIKQLELENLHLKQLIGTLSLEKKLLADRLSAFDRGGSSQTKSRPASTS
jgi:AcrR family transcriptional regulator